MIRSELVQRLADANPRLYAKDCEAVVDAIIGRIADAIAAGDRVELRGFGAFTIVEARARVGRNPRTGAPVAVKAKAKLCFKAGKDMRDRLNPAASKRCIGRWFADRV
ncbi:integration host factor subunit beta [Methylobacterium sp. WL30]|uniref:HU family DNA-binding protein n=1 Tax=unclassified Methylobacterium TaxID=2615210 RepID=UPI0011CC5D21|nr:MULTISPECIES: HU family DNA-binding protein [unclassified Methylobacterium]TXN32743.1 integration host factor subunit beta [Methylobacterium sp. WL93]TXN47455.1 integration host factor subunit beta [Methylobacterium sp. WL119]TXN61977.1 integration host factor subunit beta [Methylobacterium sp. WL30]